MWQAYQIRAGRRRLQGEVPDRKKVSGSRSVSCAGQQDGAGQPPLAHSQRRPQTLDGASPAVVFSIACIRTNVCCTVTPADRRGDGPPVLWQQAARRPDMSGYDRKNNNPAPGPPTTKPCPRNVRAGFSRPRTRPTANCLPPSDWRHRSEMIGNDRHTKNFRTQPPFTRGGNPAPINVRLCPRKQ